MAQIFISYVEEDSPIALEIAEGLGAAGYSTWYYERDSVPGPSYLLQMGDAIDDSDALLLIVSPSSILSSQVTSEVIRGHEKNKPFIPLLHGLSHSEFQERAPIWRQALGASTATEISEDIPSVVSKILEGLAAYGVEPVQQATAGTRSCDMLVGRDRKIGELVGTLDDAVAGEGRLVMLAGEPGEQVIRFTTTTDGVSICYATVGQGPALVKAPNWLNHLEYEWQSPVWRHWWQELAKDHLVIRFDQRGCGLSDWSVEDLSFAARVSDLEAVVDAVGLDSFALLGISQGGAVAVEYAVRHPERVSRLVLIGAYARGDLAREETEEQRAEREALYTLMKQGWGRDDPAYRQIFTLRFMPEATLEQMRWFNELQRVSASPEGAVRSSIESRKIDVRDRLPLVSTPTLILHARGDAMVSFEEGRLMASMIRSARFVPLESKNHLIIETEPAWQKLLSEVRLFLGT